MAFASAACTNTHSHKRMRRSRSRQLRSRYLLCVVMCVVMCSNVEESSRQLRSRYLLCVVVCVVMCVVMCSNVEVRSRQLRSRSSLLCFGAAGIRQRIHSAMAYILHFFVQILKKKIEIYVDTKDECIMLVKELDILMKEPILLRSMARTMCVCVCVCACVRVILLCVILHYITFHTHRRLGSVVLQEPCVCVHRISLPESAVGTRG